MTKTALVTGGAHVWRSFPPSIGPSTAKGRLWILSDDDRVQAQAFFRPTTGREKFRFGTHLFVRASARYPEGHRRAINRRYWPALRTRSRSSGQNGIPSRRNFLSISNFGRLQLGG